VKITRATSEDGRLKFAFHAVFAIIWSFGLCVWQREVTADAMQEKAKATRHRELQTAEPCEAPSGHSAGPGTPAVLASGQLAAPARGLTPARSFLTRYKLCNELLSLETADQLLGRRRIKYLSDFQAAIK